MRFSFIIEMLVLIIKNTGAVIATIPMMLSMFIFKNFFSVVANRERQ
jgi:hypothetical protein